MITGLPVGSYLLRYRRCLTSAGRIVGSRAAAGLEPTALAASAASASGYVTGGHVTTLGPVTVRPQAARPAAEMPTRPAITRFTSAQLRRHFSRPSSAQNFGGIAGRVLGPHGRPIKGLCFNVYFGGGGGSFGGPVGADGRYSTGKNVPPGRYTVGFTSACAFPDLTASGNWAPEWYRAQFRQSAANPVVVKAGKITRGIDAVMRRGGVISGVVTGHGGRGLAGVCVVAVSPNGTLVQQVTTPRNGGYRFQGLDPGRYGIGFFPHCGLASAYLPQWWPGRASETKQGLIKTGFGTARTRVDARLTLGGTISGVVKFRNRHGQPIKGICVDVTLPGRPDFDALAATDAKGEYAVRGLPADHYSVSFGTGCNNNGNFLSQNYPHDVAVRLARVTSNINAYLQPGAIVTGTVTARSTGSRLAGICVTNSDGDSAAETGANGTYALDQISPGTIQVQFFNCDNHGNFAPQFYPDQVSAASAASLKVRSGQVVRGIDATLRPGATISGTITLASGRALSNVCVDAISTGLSADLGGGSTESKHGRYVIEDLAAGEFQVEYSPCYGPEIADAWFMRPGKATVDETKADQIYVPPGGVAPAINAVLQLGGSVSGWIHGPANQQGSYVCPIIYQGQTFIDANAFALPVGDGYTFPGFAPGKYRVEFFPCSGQNLAVQWYDRASRPGKATPIVIRANHTTQNVNAWLTAGGSITGRVVSKATGKPVSGVCVFAVSVNQPFSGFGDSDKSGTYVVTGLNSGTYRLYFSSCGSRSHLVPLVTGRLRAIQGKNVAGPAVAMTSYQPGAIAGRVAVARSQRRPLTGVCVEAFPVTGGFVGELEQGVGMIGSNGFYRIVGLIPGKYRILVGNPNCGSGPVGLVQQWYLNTSLMSKATVVTVTANRTIKLVHVRLQQDGALSGTVTGPKPGGKPLAGICVQVTPVGPGAAGATPFLAESAASDGSYLINPVPPGKYLVEFEARCAAQGYATQWWQGAGKLSAATPVIVRADRTRSSIDASMSPTG